LLFIDVAISIPFINYGSSSMVHIYRGSKDGLILTPSQVNRKEEKKKNNLIKNYFRFFKQKH
jgi:hypothetical protein